MSENTSSRGLHIAIIPDGNRRWAKKQGLMAWKGHEKSAENFRTLIDWCSENAEISVLTLWVFSTENWKRDPKEVEKLMGMFVKYLTRERPEFQKRQMRFTHTGRKDRLSPDLHALIAVVEAETERFESFTLNVALDYGGKDEIVRTIERLKTKNPSTPLRASEEMIRANLDHPELPDMDLIIRTSGEMRTSNFALWQSTYAEWYFSEKLFPDFGTEDLQTAIEEYHHRKRRFGS